MTHNLRIYFGVAAIELAAHKCQLSLDDLHLAQQCEKWSEAVACSSTINAEALNFIKYHLNNVISNFLVLFFSPISCLFSSVTTKSSRAALCQCMKVIADRTPEFVQLADIITKVKD